MENRNEFQEHLKNILNHINRTYKDDIASLFTITLGDEFQGLMHCGSHIMDIIYYIKKEAHPIQIRFGIGIGSISTQIDASISIGADGPAYYCARDCIEQLKLKEKKKENGVGDIEIKIEDQHYCHEMTMNSIFRLMYSIENNWTQRQKSIIDHIIIYNETQTQTAKYFNVTQSKI